MGRGAGGPAPGGPGACGAKLMGRVDLDMFPIICRALILLFCGSIDTSSGGGLRFCTRLFSFFWRVRGGDRC